MSSGPRTMTLAVTPSDITLFRFSAVTWNPHRIHFNDAYARSEGRPGALVHSHLRAAYAMRAATDLAGRDRTIEFASYRVTRNVTPGTTLSYTAEVDHCEEGHSILRVVETDEQGNVGLEGTFRLSPEKE